ncbi:MAG: hypothetical protein EOP39_19940, partial [Rubrivivax sp.]
MNRSYRSIWNALTNTWVAAPESARAGRASGRAAVIGTALLMSLGFMPAAHAQLSLTLGSGLAVGLNGAIALSGLFNPAASASGAGAVAIGTNALSSGTNSIVLGINSTDSGLSNVLSIGSTGNGRRLINLSAGTIGSGSTDAVNGDQLFTTNLGQLTLGNATAAALGGGAAYSLLSGVTAPTYSILGASLSGVGGAFTAVDVALTSQGSTLGTHTTQITANAAGLVAANVTLTTQGNTLAAHTTALADAATALTNNAAAITANTASITAQAGLISTNTTGLASLGATVTAQTGLLANHASALVDAGARIDTNTASITAHATLLSGLNSSAANSVQYDDSSRAQVTFGGTTGTVLANVAAGSVTAGSLQAVNGGQLFQTHQAIAANTAQIASNTGDIANHTTNIANLTQQINAVGPGLVRQASAGADLTVGALTDGAAIDVSGTAGARRLSGVAAGDVNAGSTQAVNGAQLHQTNQAVAANTAAVATQGSTLAAQGITLTSHTTLLATHGAAISANTASLNNQGTALVALDGIALKYDSGLRNMVTLGGAGGTTISNVAAGAVAAGSLQAVNGGQLHQVRQQVEANTASIAALGSAQAINVGMQSNNVAGAAAPAATGDNATAVGYGASAAATGGTALGNGAASTGSNSVALGQGSTDDGAANVVSVGSAVQKRRLTNLADGVADSDAATAGQVRNVDERVNTLSARAVNYDVNADQSVNYASVSFGSAGAPVRLRNVGAGTAATDAANVGQLQSLASGIGGGMQLQGNGAFSQPSFSINQVASDISVSVASFGSVSDALSSMSQSIGALASSGGTGTGGPMTVHNYTVHNTIMQAVQDEDMYVNVNSVNPDSVALGTDSTAIGPMAEAQGDHAIAIGTAAQAQTASSVAIGDGAIAGAGRSVSIGQGNIAMGNGAVAIGDPNLATGTGAVARFGSPMATAPL